MKTTLRDKATLRDKLDKLITDEFPFETFNPGQLEVIRQAVIALASGTKHVIISAPTGSGKSAIGITIHRVLQRLNGQYRSCIITTTIGLQQQYRHDYPEILDLKSKVHYPCTHNFTNGECYYNTPPCITIRTKKVERRGRLVPQCDKFKDCPYLKTRVRWSNSSDIKTTNSSFFTTAGIKTISGDLYVNAPLDLCIIDECHEIESVLTDKSACKIRLPLLDTPDGLEQLKLGKQLPYPNAMIQPNGDYTPFAHDYYKLVDIINKLPTDRKFTLLEISPEDLAIIEKVEYNTKQAHDTVKESIERAEATMNDKSSVQVDPKLLSRLTSIKSELSGFLTSISFLTEHELRNEQYEWILRTEVEQDYTGKNKRKPRVKSKTLSVVPLSLAAGPIFTHRPLFSKAKQFVHMSATICGVETYTKNLGISDYKYIEVGNPIPVENRPVVVHNSNSLYINRYSDPERISRIVDNIISKQPENTNGVIHTVSFKLAADILKYSGYNSRMIVSNNREEILSKLSSSKGVIILSPSIETGYDFKGDLANWQIISKVPFLNLGDLYVAQRREISNRWYSRETILRTIQASGRICRGVSDYGVTYVIDKNFIRLIRANTSMIPDWYLNSIIIT